MGIPPNLSTGGSDDGVEAWVIIVPIVVAIIIIVVVAILLYFVSSPNASIVLHIMFYFCVFYVKFGFFKRKQVDKGDEVDLTTAWQTPDTAGGETIPQTTAGGETIPETKESSPPTST